MPGINRVTENLEMDATWKTVLWQQFGASIDMLENALVACPDALWGDRSQRPEFWYVVYHTLFYLDLYLSGSAEGFTPPAPFTLDELKPEGAQPERVYTRGQMRTYLEHCRRKCHGVLEALTYEKAQERCIFGWIEMGFAELLLYNMRHVQHHAAQLNLILRQKTDSAPGWVASAEDRL
jgi:hypothetical protein